LTRYALTLEYDGAPFLGLQRQPQGPTVQSAIEAAALAITGEPTNMVAAGRTDAGVHALAMRAHIDVNRDMPPFRLMEALNALMRPAPVAVLACAGQLARAVFLHGAQLHLSHHQPPRALDGGGRPGVAHQAPAGCRCHAPRRANPCRHA